MLYGHQLMLPVPDLDRTSYFLVFGANPMASNGSLMTVPDFPKRLRELKGRGGRMVVLRPAPHRDREGRRPRTTSCDPARTPTVLLAMLHVILEEGLAATPDYVDARRRARDPRHRVHPGARRGGQRSAGRDDPAGGPRLRGGRPRGGVRTDRGLHARLRVGVPVGDPAASISSPATSTERVGSSSPSRPSTPSAGASSDPATSTPGARGCAGCRNSPGSCRPRRCARRSRHPARPDPCGGHRSRQPGPVHPRRRRPGAGARDTRLHGQRSTSTSTRPPDTPT